MLTAVSVDMASVLRALQIGIKPVGSGFVLEANPQIYLKGPVWKHTKGQFGPAGLFTHGYSVHFFVEYYSMRLEQALDTVCSVAEPALMEYGMPQRMLPKERLQQAKRTYWLEKLAKAGRETDAEKETAEARLPEEKTEDEERARVCLADRGIAQEIITDIFASQTAYAAKSCIVFPGYTDKAQRCWYYVLSVRNRADEGHIGAHAGAFSAWPWIWGARRSECLHVYSTPLEALAYLTLELHTNPLIALKQDTHAALTEIQGASGVFGYLSRTPFVRKLVLHLSNNKDNEAVARSIEAQLRHDPVTVLQKPPAGTYRSWLQMLEGAGH